MSQGKFLFTGPESSGKTTLATWASERWAGVLVPEFARIYLDGMTRNYDMSDLVEIAHRQMLIEKMAHRKNRPIFCDTSLMVINIWMMERFGASLWDHGFDPGHLEHYDVVFLCTPDFPWVADELRENPDDRDRLYERYRNEWQLINAPIYEIRGSKDERKLAITQQIGERVS